MSGRQECLPHRGEQCWLLAAIDAFEHFDFAVPPGIAAALERRLQPDFDQMVGQFLADQIAGEAQHVHALLKMRAVLRRVDAAAKRTSHLNRDNYRTRMFSPVVKVGGTSIIEWAKPAAVKLWVSASSAERAQIERQGFPGGEKREIVPICGVKMPIPLESTRPSSKLRRTPPQAIDTAAAQAAQTTVRRPAGPAWAECGVGDDSPTLIGTKSMTVVEKRVASRDPLSEWGTSSGTFTHPPAVNSALRRPR